MSASKGRKIHQAVVSERPNPVTPRAEVIADEASRLLIEVCPDAVVLADDDGRFLDMNDAACDLFGRPRDEVLKIRVGDLITRESPGAGDRYAQYLQTGRESGEFAFIRPDGELRVAFYSACRMAEGRHLSILRDITAREHMEQRIRRANERLTDILETIGEAFVSIDSDWRYTYVNAEAERILDRQRESLLGRDMRVEHSSAEARRAHKRFAQAFLTNASVSFESYHAMFGIWLEIRAYPTAEGLSIFFRDVSERKRREIEVAQLNERLHRAVGESSHRIKNQLQILAATVDMAVLEGRDAIPAAEVVRIGTQIRTLALLQDLLTSEWKAADDSYSETISTRTMLESLLDMLRRAVGVTQFTFTVADAPVPLRLATTLALLTNECVTNGLKHGNGAVDVCLEVNDSAWALQVCDDGPGFPEGFDPKSHGNTGMELIVALVEHDLQGNVRFENLPTGGARIVATFRVTAEPPHGPSAPF
jgi:PAS domain S-box-containing protein